MTSNDQRALVIGEALIDIVERDGRSSASTSAAARSTSPSDWPGWAAASTSSPTSATTSAAAASANTSKRSGAQLVSGSVTAERTPTALATLDDERLGAVRVRHRLAAGGHAGGGAAAGRAHRIDRDGAGARLPCHRRAARRLPPLGDGHVRPERAAGADRGRRTGAGRIDRSSNGAMWSRPATRTCAGSTRTARPNRSRGRGWRWARRSSR